MIKKIEKYKMKTIYTITIFLFLGCSSNEKNHKHDSSNNEKTTIKPEQIEIKNDQKIKGKLDYEKYQDSLRKLLYNSKPNQNLKLSILQELYLRGLVHKVNEKLIFNLPFDLHGLDCGAPDCYSTDFKFEIPYNKPIEFPETIEFTMNEWGCYVDPEIKIKGKFKLIERSSEFINYYSYETKGNLIIKKKGKLYYFPNTEPNAIKVDLIDKMLESFNDENPKFEYPYQSTIMNAFEYDRFINKI